MSEREFERTSIVVFFTDVVMEKAHHFGLKFETEGKIDQGSATLI